MDRDRITKVYDCVDVSAFHSQFNKHVEHLELEALHKSYYAGKRLQLDPLLKKLNNLQRYSTSTLLQCLERQNEIIKESWKRYDKLKTQIEALYSEE